MWRVIWGELWHRRARTAALLAGILVATAAFAVFSGTSDTQTLQVRGTVGHNFRSSYDILVRPKGTETAIERSQGLVRDNYLSGIFGGITMAQYHRVARIRGVEVAAPIAMVGYVLQPVQFQIDLSPYLTHAPRQLFSVQVSRSTDRGLVHLTDQKGFMYVTSRTIAPLSEITAATPYIGPKETLSDRRTRVVCPTTSSQFASANPFRHAERDIETCWSRRTGLQGFGWQDSGFKTGHFGITVDWSFPFLLAAINPQAEARLDGVNETVVRGRYLRSGDLPTVRQDGDAGVKTDVPVLVSTHPYIDDHDHVTVRRLGKGAVQQLLHAPLAKVAAGQLPGSARGSTVLRRFYSTADAYRNLLHTISHQQTAVIENYWTSGPTRYRQLGPRRLAPIAADHPLSVWKSAYQFTGAVDASIDSKLTGYRPLHAHVGVGHDVTTVHLPTLKAVGQFDPTKLPGFSPLSRLPQETYNPPVAAPANARTRRLLHGHDLLPDSNLAGYLQAPPLLLTDLNSLPAFNDSTVFPSGNSTAPISVIRVRVADVHGDTALSRERVRLVAQQIEQDTGLQVDVTIGSSPTPVQVDLPAIARRPALQLSEGWVKKGVAVTIITALNNQSAILFLLILIVCGLFVHNAASASVQSRRTELGVLACLGWSARSLFTVILGELTLVGLTAGVLGGLLAIPVATLAGFHASALHALLAVPAAVVLVLLAGLPPAIRAARMSPAAAIRPVGRSRGHAWRTRGITKLAAINTIRVPGRSVLAALSLTFGIAALTLLLAISVVFHNALAGTLLGSAISLQIRGADYAAVIVIVLLGAAAVADVLYLNLRDRAAELATLHATGWSDLQLTRLISSEALCIGLGGSLLGAGLGLASAATYAGALPGSLILLAIIATLAGLLVTILASILPSLLVTRLPTVPLLAGE